MNRVLKIIICIVVCVSMTASFVSCERLLPIGGEHLWHEGCVVPDGYTGGLGWTRKQLVLTEVKWLETYEELKTAIDLLRSNGNNVPKQLIFNCEEEGIDVKFCITFDRDSAEKLKEGQNYFDRKLEHIFIEQYIFLKDVTIETLEYSEWYLYDAAYVDMIEQPDDPADDIEIKLDDYDEYLENTRFCVFYNDKFQGLIVFGLKSVTFTEEQLEVLKRTLEAY